MDQAGRRSLRMAGAVVLAAVTMAGACTIPPPETDPEASTTTTESTTTTSSTTTTTTTVPPGGSGPPVNTAVPTLNGATRVGDTLAVNAGNWTGASPVTFSYRYRSCNSSGASCTNAPGLFPNGSRPQLLLLAATAGRRIKVEVTATNPSGERMVATALTPVIDAYPTTAAPKVEFVNGLPDDVSWSNHSIFQFQATGTGVTLSCRLDSQSATTCPANGKVSYANLSPGQHTVRVTATNANGSDVATYSWQVQSLPAPTACPGCYHPPVGSTWQWQLNPDSGASSINTSIVADMYEIDGFANSASVVSTLHSLPGTSAPSRGVTCYWAAGTSENWRPDAPQYDPMLLGNPYFGFEDERWIDIRRISQLAPLLEARMDMCAAKGFDAIEFDNMDAWYSDNNTGLNITEADSTAFVVWLAREAHERGLSMALKSVVELVPAVRHHVDFSVVEECFQNNECTRSDPNTGGAYGYDMMIEIGKAVFAAEYLAYNPTNNVCARSNSLGFATLYKRVDLDSYRVSCN